MCLYLGSLRVKYVKNSVRDAVKPKFVVCLVSTSLNTPFGI